MATCVVAKIYRPIFIISVWARQVGAGASAPGSHRVSREGCGHARARRPTTSRASSRPRMTSPVEPTLIHLYRRHLYVDTYTVDTYTVACRRWASPPPASASAACYKRWPTLRKGCSRRRAERGDTVIKRKKERAVLQSCSCSRRFARAPSRVGLTAQAFERVSLSAGPLGRGGLVLIFYVISFAL